MLVTARSQDPDVALPVGDRKSGTWVIAALAGGWSAGGSVSGHVMWDSADPDGGPRRLSAHPANAVLLEDLWSFSSVAKGECQTWQTSLQPTYFFFFFVNLEAKERKILHLPIHCLNARY